MKLAQNVWRHGGGVLSQAVKFNRGQNSRKVHFHKFGKKRDRTIHKIKKKCAQKHVSCRLPLVSRICLILLLISKLGRENMRFYRYDSNTWYVVMDVKTNSSHTNRSLCPRWHVLTWLCNKSLWVLYAKHPTYNNVATWRLRAWRDYEVAKS